MEDRKVIITIGRQFGSGGRVIGHKLAERLGIAYYDKELITLASKESGICGEFFEKADEMFQIQSDVIRKVAAEKSCILVGRCADYILRDNKDCLSVFISASLEDRIRRAMEYNDKLKASDAEEFLRKADKSRASYYNYYTDKTWGTADSYDLCINSSYLGIDKTIDYILSFLQARG